MKKIVRLTEGDLHNIIRESVNNIIQELDWRTYANAANKSAERQKDYKEKSKEKKWYDSILPSRARKRQGKISNLADKENDSNFAVAFGELKANFWPIRLSARTQDFHS